MKAPTLIKGENRIRDDDRNEKGQYSLGKATGRPRGSISAVVKLRNRFLETIGKLDKEHDGDYILHFAKNHPDKFLPLVATLLPKNLKIESETKHIHIGVMDLPEDERVKILNECRERVRELRGDDVIDVESVKILDVGDS